ncbi:DUF6270 domain-containing protein [Alteromonas gracilis]|uniref:DUF6270 domain-containing protein n=1 Tax=Alteromonas gracilis TaxID=1479524 RepID=UPI0036F241B8
MKSIAIFGSCVSRDSIEVKKEKFELLEYFSRSSFATFCSEPFTGDLHFIDEISSSFQKKMVGCDLNKSALNSPSFSKADYILIDLIDERFELLQFNDNEFATLSLELSQIIKDKKDIKRIPTDSLWYFKRFEEGFVKFMKETDVEPSNIRVIQTHWALRNNDGKSTVNEYKLLNNLKLDILYSILQKYLPISCFIKIPVSYLISDVKHKWGDAPYHYVKEFYELVMDYLEE